MSFPRYPKYRDSGVEWLGAIPAHWQAARIKRLGRLKGGAGFPPADQGQSEEELPFYKVAALAGANRDGTLRGSADTISRSRAAELGAFVFPAGAIVFAKVGAALLLRRIRTLSEEACIDNNMMGLIIDPKHVLASFLRYAMELVRFDLLANPGAVPSVGAEQVGEWYLPVPSMAEQESISRFLDTSLAEIDAAIAEQQRLIELLKEKRRAVISHAVTKGLNPDAPMMPSGVDWLGDVPAHWSVLPIRIAARLESGHTPSRAHPEYWQNCTVPWFTLADVWQIRDAKADYVFETKEKISEVGLANSAARLLPKGTVMLSRTASVGFSAIMGVDMATTQDFANWVCRPGLIPEYLLCALRSMKGEFERLKMGSTHNTIYMPDIESLRFARPPLTEQAAIVEHIGRFVEQVDSVVHESARAIALLQERRTALISAAVTGKIDVRGLADFETGVEAA